jgi:hypothetical protein
MHPKSSPERGGGPVGVGGVPLSTWHKAETKAPSVASRHLPVPGRIIRDET